MSVEINPRPDQRREVERTTRAILDDPDKYFAEERARVRLEVIAEMTREANSTLELIEQLAPSEQGTVSKENFSELYNRAVWLLHTEKGTMSRPEVPTTGVPLIDKWYDADNVPEDLYSAIINALGDLARKRLTFLADLD